MADGKFPHRVLAMTVAISSFIAARPAFAEKMINEGPGVSDPILSYAEMSAPRNQFFLNSSDDVELIRFKRVHDIDICAARPDRNAIGSAKRGYAIQVKFDGETAVVAPGNCLSFEAQRVSVRPAESIPQSIELTGTIHVVH